MKGNGVQNTDTPVTQLTATNSSAIEMVSAAFKYRRQDGKLGPVKDRGDQRENNKI